MFKASIALAGALAVVKGMGGPDQAGNAGKPLVERSHTVKLANADSEGTFDIIERLDSQLSGKDVAVSKISDNDGIVIYNLSIETPDKGSQDVADLYITCRDARPEGAVEDASVQLKGLFTESCWMDVILHGTDLFALSESTGDNKFKVTIAGNGQLEVSLMVTKATKESKPQTENNALGTNAGNHLDVEEAESEGEPIETEQTSQTANAGAAAAPAQASTTKGKSSGLSFGSKFLVSMVASGILVVASMF